MKSQREVLVRGSEFAGADIAFVLLLLQGGFGSVSTLGMLFFVVAAPALAMLGLFAAAMAVLPVVLAIGVVRLQRWARVGASLFEGLLLLGAALRLLLYHGFPPGIVWLLAEVALPVAVGALVWSPIVHTGTGGMSASGQSPPPR